MTKKVESQTQFTFFGLVVSHGCHFDPKIKEMVPNILNKFVAFSTAA